MIRTAIIYKIIDHCIDLVFDNISRSLLSPEIAFGLKSGAKIRYLAVRYSENYSRTFYSPTLGFVSEDFVEICFNFVQSQWHSVKDVDRFAENLRDDLRKSPNVKQFSVKVVKLTDTVISDVEYESATYVGVKPYQIDPLHSNFSTFQ